MAQFMMMATKLTSAQKNNVNNVHDQIVLTWLFTFVQLSTKKAVFLLFEHYWYCKSAHLLLQAA